MEDNNNNEGQNPISIADIISEEQNKKVAKLAAVRAAKLIKNENSNWSVTQEILQEIMASHLLHNEKPPIRQLKEELVQEIKVRYEGDEETQKILIDGIPTDYRLKQSWIKKKGWEDAVWGKVRSNGMFSNEKRAEILAALFQKATQRQDVSAIKLWLTLSGDYSEAGIKELDKTMEAYREINEILHKKSN